MTTNSTGAALRNPTFRKLWIAAVISRTCVAAHDSAATWMMNLVFSPHAWGWSGKIAPKNEEAKVLTRGDGPYKDTQNAKASQFSHTRGDGPAALAAIICFTKFSPHAWGWSGQTILD